jgi:hypothetical protein
MTRDQVAQTADGRVVVTFDKVPIELPPVVGPIVRDHINNHGPASYRVGETAWLFPGRQPGRTTATEAIRAESSSATASTHEPPAAQPCSPSPDRYPPPSSPTSSASVPASVDRLSRWGCGGPVAALLVEMG